MCNFFSFVHDGKHIYYFDGSQRKNGVKMPDGNRIGSYDSHSSITCYYGLDDDAVNKFEYNPYADKLVLDGKTICQWDEKSVRAELAKIDWQPIAGDVQGARAFIAGLKDIPFLQPDGTVKDGENGVRLYKTRKAASAAALDTARDALDAVRIVARDAALAAARIAVLAVLPAARDAALAAVRIAARDVALDAAIIAAENAAWGAALYCSIIYACDGLTIDPAHFDHIKKRWEIWRHGYGVACDVDGVLYCYEQVE